MDAYSRMFKNSIIRIFVLNGVKDIGDLSGFLYVHNNNGNYSTYIVTSLHALTKENRSKDDILLENLLFPFDNISVGIVHNIDGVSSFSLSSNDLKTRSIVNFEDQDDLMVIEVSSYVPPTTPDLLNEKYIIGNNSILEKYVYASSDIVVVGYPMGFIDSYNKFPIFKHGIISTIWNSLYEGNNEFLVDCNLFPASSGSLVISKPTNTVLNEIAAGTSSSIPKFAILGIFSGKEEKYEDDKFHDIGMSAVVYSSRIIPLLSNGRKLGTYIQNKNEE